MLDDVRGIAHQAGEVLVKHFNNLAEADVSCKDDGGIVTIADTETERLLIKNLKKLRPNSGVLAEESGEQREGDSRWIIDPLDGTSNFASGIPWFAISIALETNPGSGNIELGVVYNPISREMFYGSKEEGVFLNGKPLHLSTRTSLEQAMMATGFYYHKGKKLQDAMRIFQHVQERVLGVRRFGAATLDLSFVACGRYDGFWEAGLAPWDLAAGIFFIQMAGGKLTDYQGKPHSIYEKETIAANDAIHSQLIQLIQHR